METNVAVQDAAQDEQFALNIPNEETTGATESAAVLDEVAFQAPESSEQPQEVPELTKADQIRAVAEVHAEKYVEQFKELNLRPEVRERILQQTVRHLVKQHQARFGTSKFGKVVETPTSKAAQRRLRQMQRLQAKRA